SGGGSRHRRQGLHSALVPRGGHQYVGRSLPRWLLGGRGSPHLHRRVCRPGCGRAGGAVAVVTLISAGRVAATVLAAVFLSPVPAEPPPPPRVVVLATDLNNLSNQPDDPAQLPRLALLTTALRARLAA